MMTFLRQSLLLGSSIRAPVQDLLEETYCIHASGHLPWRHVPQICSWEPGASDLLSKLLNRSVCPFFILSSLFSLFHQKSFSARAVSRSHQRAEHILKNLQQEEEKRRLGREASIITAIPVAQEACYEPTCSPPPEQEEEGGVFFLCMDDTD